MHGPSFSDSTLALQAAADGHGVALGRRILVEHLIAQGTLVQLFNISATIEEAFFVVYLKDSLQRAEVAAFIDWIKSVEQEDQRDSKSPQTIKPAPLRLTNNRPLRVRGAIANS